MAEPILHVRGDLKRAAENVVEDAIVDLTTGCKKLAKSYFGVKDYECFRGQRSDHSYMMGPRHGRIVLAIELTTEARRRLVAGESFTDDEINEAVSMLRLAANLPPNPLATLGPPPPTHITVDNPAWATWVEHAAINMCEDHGPSPCSYCLRLARRYAVVGAA